MQCLETAIKSLLQGKQPLVIITPLEPQSITKGKSFG